MKPSWFAHGKQLIYGTVVDADVRAVFETEADAKKAALALEAGDVMARRGWNPAVDIQGNWFVEDRRSKTVHHIDQYGNPARLPDPLTALVEADRYRDNLDAQKQKAIELIE